MHKVPTMYARLIQGYQAMDPEQQALSAYAARQLRLMVSFLENFLITWSIKNLGRCIRFPSSHLPSNLSLTICLLPQNMSKPCDNILKKVNCSYFSDVWVFSTSSTSHARMGNHHWTLPFRTVWDDWGEQTQLKTNSWVISLHLTTSHWCCVSEMFLWLYCFVGLDIFSLSWQYQIHYGVLGRQAQLANRFLVCRLAGIYWLWFLILIVSIVLQRDIQGLPNVIWII